MITQIVKLSAVLLALFLSISLFAGPSGSDIISAASKKQAGLGQGYDPNREILKGRCIVGKSETQGVSTGTTNFQQKISFDQLESELGLGAAGRARFGVVSASAAAKFLSNSKSDTFSIVAIYSGDFAFKNVSLIDPAISPEAQAIKDNDERWEKACGSEFVQQLVMGAKIYFTIRIDFASEQEKKSFEASFNISAPLWGAEGSLKTASNQFSKRTQVTITTLQIGGEVNRVSEIYGNPDNLVSCSMGQFEECSKVLSSAIRYATQEFPKQIAKDTLEKIGTGPAVLEYLTSPYENAGIFPKTPPEVQSEVKLSRTRLDDLLTENYSMFVFADRYNKGAARRLSPRQTEIVEKAKNAISGNLKKIGDTAQLCYDDYDMRCVNAVDALAKGLTAIDKSAFIIRNESFAQFCDDGTSPGASSLESLRNSVNGLIALAKDLKPESFRPPAKDVPVDECYIAGTVFAGFTKLNASNRGIQDLRPLMEFTQFEELDLSNNNISDLEPFEGDFVVEKGGFKNLKSLNLHNNRIESLEALGSLANLENLNLSNNRVTNTNPLLKLSHFKRVDLRNNSQDLKLNLSYPAVVLTADYGNSVSFGKLPLMPEIHRYAHQALRLDNGDILITGGTDAPDASTSGAELFEAVPSSFARLNGMNESRQFHTMTRLKDGRILIVGGPKSTSGEIFDPVNRSFSPLRSDLVHRRYGHTATLLGDGRVLLTGGWTNTGFLNSTLSAEVWDPSTGKFSPLGSNLSMPRAGHSATTLHDGRVLITGGMSTTGATNAVDIYDPKVGQIVALGSRMQMKRTFHTATLLPDGRVLILGGIFEDAKALNSAEIFDPKTNRFQLLDAHMELPRMGHQAGVLSNGLVVITGGSNAGIGFTTSESCPTCLSSAEIFDPNTMDFTLINNQMDQPRAFFTMTPLAGNDYLIVGGAGKEGSLTAEVMTYGNSNFWRAWKLWH